MSDSSAYQTEILEILATILQKKVTLEDNIFDIGADSLDLSNAMAKIAEKYNIKLKTKELMARPYTEDMIAFIVDRIEKSTI